jgi:hypothetical protein
MPLLRTSSRAVRVVVPSVVVAVLVFLGRLLLSDESVWGALVIALVTGLAFAGFQVWSLRRQSAGPRARQ